jgi:hypothetical protein
MCGEEDVEGHEEQRSPFVTSLKNKSGRWKNGRDRSKGVRWEDKQSNPPPEYHLHFITYAKLTKARQEIFEIVKNNFDMQKPLKIDLFEVKDLNQWCHFHRSKGDNTSDCLQLKDILEKLSRQVELTKFISQDFYKKFTSRYDGSERKFRNTISRYDGEGLFE